MSDDGIVRPCAARGNVCLRQAAKKLGRAVAFAIGAFAAIEACNASTSNQNALDESEFTASIPATIHIDEPQAGITAEAFASRFDCPQARSISAMVTAAYQAPLRKNRDYSFAAE